MALWCAPSNAVYWCTQTSFMNPVPVDHVKAETGSVCSLQLQDNVQPVPKFHRRSGSYSALSNLASASGNVFSVCLYKLGT